MTPDKQGPRGERGPRGPRGIRGRAVPQSLHDAEVHEDDLRVDELQQLIDDLPDKQVQFVLHKLWQIGTHGSAVAIGRVDHQVRRMIRVVTLTLLFVAVVLAFVGVLSVTSTIDQGHTAARAKHLALQIQHQRYQSTLDSCQETNQRYHAAVHRLRVATRQELKVTPRLIVRLFRGAGIQITHPAPLIRVERASIQGNYVSTVSLLAAIVPRHADCKAYARNKLTS